MYINVEDKEIPILYCDTFIKRLFGMTFKKKKQPYLYCFPKCNSIHTFFMFQNIDVIMTDKNNKIIYTHENMKANSIIFPKKNVYYTYEFSHNHGLYEKLITQGNFNIQKK